MKRLFFLFAFIFIGFGAFGYADNYHTYTPNNQLFIVFEHKKNTFYTDTIPKKKRMNNWYFGEGIGPDFGVNHIMFKDDLISEIPYAGLGVYFLLPLEIIQPNGIYYQRIYFEGGLSSPIRSYRNSPDFSPAKGYRVFNMGFYIDFNYLFRLVKSHHYMGVHYDMNIYTHSVDSDLSSSNVSTSVGLAYIHYNKIFGIPTRLNVTLPILVHQPLIMVAPQVKPFVILNNHFNPSVDIAFFLPIKCGRDNDFILSYTLNYMNINREFSTYHHMKNSINLGFLF